MTIALFPRRAHRFGRSSRMRDAVAGLPMRKAAAQPTVNPGRWAALADEYTGPWACPLDMRLPAIAAPSITTPIACGVNGAVVLHLAGTWRGHVTFEGSADGLTWRPVALFSLASGVAEGETDHPGLWRMLPNQQAAYLRLHVADLSQGALLVSISAAPPAFQATRRSLDSAA